MVWEDSSNLHNEGRHKHNVISSNGYTLQRWSESYVAFELSAAMAYIHLIAELCFPVWIDCANRFR